MREFLHLDATDVLGLAVCSVLRESMRSIPDTCRAAASDPPGPAPTWRWQPKSASRQLPPAESHGFKGCPWGGMHPRELQAMGQNGVWQPESSPQVAGVEGCSQLVKILMDVTEHVASSVPLFCHS